MILKKLQSYILNNTGIWIKRQKNLSFGVDLFTDLKKINGKNLSTIFDIGGNIGQSAEVFRSHFPDSKVYSFEPVKINYEILSNKFKNDKQVITEQLAFGNQQGNFSIYINNHNSLHSFIPDLAEATGEIEKVKISTIDHFIEQHNIHQIDLLKTDTEGYDLEVLKGAAGALKDQKIKMIISEAGIYPENKRHTNLFELIKFLRLYNYYFCCIYNTEVPGTEGICGNALFTLKRF